MGAMTAALAHIKARMQAQQTGIFADRGGAIDSQVRLAQRAEFDALWAAVEVLAQEVDGTHDVVVPDYFADRPD
ncbi:hypothetical protein [Microbacterium sp.]|jgi:hypothetical protein|uniref:hypothetical protein n=1 Tax=Microbacterium sp. TaxID=51671 RepID=UPI0037C527F9